MEDNNIPRQLIFDYVKKSYAVEPDYPWMKYQESAVLRHKDSKKWFALLMPVRRDKLGLELEGEVDVLTLKCEPLLIDSLVQCEGFHRAYHMNKTQWMTIRLDGSVALEQIKNFIDMSYELTDKKKKGGGEEKI